MSRIHRHRHDDHQFDIDQIMRGPAGDGSSRQLVQVYDGGAIPTSVPRVFLTNPVELSGDECEGCTETASVDSGTTIPVVVVGTRVPVAGDNLIAMSTAGRWVAEMGGHPVLACSPCNIPKQDFTLSWTNSMLGDGSVPFPQYIEGLTWRALCIGELIFFMQCNGGLIQFGVTYFLSGDCPSGQTQTCQSPGYAPFGLELLDYTCDPFHLHFGIRDGDCPGLGLGGYTDFYVDE